MSMVLFCSFSAFFGYNIVVGFTEIFTLPGILNIICLLFALLLCLFSIIIKSHSFVLRICALSSGLVLLIIPFLQQVVINLTTIVALLCIIISSLIFLIENFKLSIIWIASVLMACNVISASLLLFGMDAEFFTSSASLIVVNICSILYFLSFATFLIIIILLFVRTNWILCLIGLGISAISFIIPLATIGLVNITYIFDSFYTINFYFSLICLLASLIFLLSYMPTWVASSLVTVLLVFTVLCFVSNVGLIVQNIFFLIPSWVIIVVIVSFVIGIVLSYCTPVTRWYDGEIAKHGLGFFILIVFVGLFVIYLPLEKANYINTYGMLSCYFINSENQAEVYSIGWECKDVGRIYIPDSVTGIILKENCFNNILNKVEYIILTKDIKVIDGNIFHDCEDLIVLCYYDESEVPTEWSYDFTDESCTIIYGVTADTESLYINI